MATSNPLSKNFKFIDILYGRASLISMALLHSKRLPHTLASPIPSPLVYRANIHTDVTIGLNTLNPAEQQYLLLQVGMWWTA